MLRFRLFAFGALDSGLGPRLFLMPIIVIESFCFWGTHARKKHHAPTFYQFGKKLFLGVLLVKNYRKQLASFSRNVLPW